MGHTCTYKHCIGTVRGDTDRVSYCSKQSYNIRSGTTQLHHVCASFKLLSSLCMRLGRIAAHKSAIHSHLHAAGKVIKYGHMHMWAEAHVG